MTDVANTEGVPSTRGPIKAAIVTKLLTRAKGASLGDINKVTGWQAHSIRSFLSGLRRKGVVLAREQRRDGVTAYRIIKANPVMETADEQVPSGD